jgi:hypothetical protein
MEQQMFTFDDADYTLESMLEANAYDDDFCAWARSAKPGDVYEGCECVLADAAEAA